MWAEAGSLLGAAGAVPRGREAVDFYPVDSEDGEQEQRLADGESPYPSAELPEAPAVGLGAPFLGTGPIPRGIELPTGQMIQPWLLLFGSLRSALQYYGPSDAERAEWANRLDLTLNLNLSGTERAVFSMRPIDSARGDYTGYAFLPSGSAEWVEDLNGRVESLFFEGDFGEIFPKLDPEDRSALDYGFSVGRQPVLLQDGLLVADTIDLVGVTRNSLTLPGVPNLRITGVYGWNDIDRGPLRGSSADHLFGLLCDADTELDTTSSADVLFVLDERGQASSWHLGVGTTQRLRGFNTTFRVAGSIPRKGETQEVGRGALLLAQVSRTLHRSDDVAYVNVFGEIGRFTSAARAPDAGLPVANLGILWAPVGTGRYGVPLGLPTSDTVGGSVGHQLFHSGIFGQLITELGGRVATKGTGDETLGIGARYQYALWGIAILRVDASAAFRRERKPAYGGRIEWVLKL